MADDFGMFQTSWMDDHPIGRESERFIEESPTWAIYIRRDINSVCPKHWSESASSKISFDDYCPVCYGLGYKSTAQIVPCRINLTITKTNMRDADTLNNPGFIEYYLARAHFPRRVYPNIEDLLIVPEWSGPQSQVPYDRSIKPVGITSSYLIKSTNPYIERELGMFEVGLETVSYRSLWATNVINNLDILPILKEDKVWGKSYW